MFFFFTDDETGSGNKLVVEEIQKTRSIPWRQLILGFGLILVALFIADVLARLVFARIMEQGWNAAAVVTEFATSPGAAGLAAVLAAGLGFYAVHRQLKHSKQVEANRSWWETFEWAADRAIPPESKYKALPARASIEILKNLTNRELRGAGLSGAAAKSWESRQNACDSLVTILLEKENERTPDNEENLRHIGSYINQGARAGQMSTRLTTRYYQLLVESHLRDLEEMYSETKVITKPNKVMEYFYDTYNFLPPYLPKGYLPDAVVTRGGKHVFVQITPKPIEEAATSVLEQFNQRFEIANNSSFKNPFKESPTVFITPTLKGLDKQKREALAEVATTIIWNGQHDNSKLLNGVSMALLTGP